MDSHIWNLYDFFTQAFNFDNSLQCGHDSGHETRNHIDHRTKGILGETPDYVMNGWFSPV